MFPLFLVSFSYALFVCLCRVSVALSLPLCLCICLSVIWVSLMFLFRALSFSCTSLSFCASHSLLVLSTEPGRRVRARAREGEDCVCMGVCARQTHTERRSTDHSTPPAPTDRPINELGRGCGYRPGAARFIPDMGKSLVPGTRRRTLRLSDRGGCSRAGVPVAAAVVAVRNIAARACVRCSKEALGPHRNQECGGS